MIDFSAILDRVPSYEQYLTVDELDHNSVKLAEEHSDSVKLLRVGKTKGGHELLALQIGAGKYNALIHAFPNPEEPLGGLVLDYMAEALANNPEILRELDYTWYIIKCIDPDGAKLTQGYLKGKYTPIDFSLNYYRTPVFDTGEENFPYRYGDVIDLNKPTPETLALMKIMSGKSFDFISSLHNMKVGGISYQVPESCPEIYAPLQHLAKTNGIFLRKRIGFMLAPGFQLAGYLTPATNYITLKGQGRSPLQKITGAYIFEYARMTNPYVFMMIPECCTWYDPRCYDDSPAGSLLRETWDYAAQSSREGSKLLVDTFKEVRSSISDHSPFFVMLDDVVEEITNPKVPVIDPDPVLTDKELGRETTIAQKTATEARIDVYRMFNIGAEIRMIEHQLASSGGDSKLVAASNKLKGKLEEFNEVVTKRYDMRHFPLKNLVAMNLGSLLYSAEYAKSRTPKGKVWV
jgi:hypothetical protein